jgi:hypothetical protein
MKNNTKNYMSKLRKRVFQSRNWYAVLWMHFCCGMIRPTVQLHPIHPKQGRAIHPPDKSRGLSGSFSVSISVLHQMIDIDRAQVLSRMDEGLAHVVVRKIIEVFGCEGGCIYGSIPRITFADDMPLN